MVSIEEQPPVRITTPSSEMSDSRLPTVGDKLAFALVGALPFLLVAWLIRKLLIVSRRHKDQTRQKHKQQILQTNHNLIGYFNRSLESNDTSTSSFPSTDESSQEFQDDSIMTSSTNEKVGSIERITSTILLVTATIEKPNSSLLLDNTHKGNDDIDLLTDGDDTVTARLYENCVRLQQSNQSHLLPSAMILSLEPHEYEIRVQEYRRACRQRRLYLDEVVPSDVELGLATTTTTTIPTKNKSTCVHAKDSKDELLYPSKRDPGIIRRYFGTVVSKMDWGNDDASSCPSKASISCGSSTSSEYNCDDNSYNGGYESYLYGNDVPELGELVDI